MQRKRLETIKANVKKEIINLTLSSVLKLVCLTHGYFKYLTIIKVAIQMKTQLMMYRYMAPKKNLKFPKAKP